MRISEFRFRLNYISNHKFKSHLTKLIGKVDEKDLKYCGGSWLRIKSFNFIDIYLPSYMLMYDDEDKIIEMISSSVGHEYAHFVLYKSGIKLDYDQHHYGTKKLGF